MDLAKYSTRSPAASYAIGWAWFALLAIVAGWALIAAPSSPVGRGLLFGLGFISLWRYSLAAIHAVRALLYRQVVFPELRRAAESAPQASHVYVVVLSFRMPPELNAAVYGALVRDLVAYGRPATVVACISDVGDLSVLEPLRAHASVHLVTVQQSTLGKRDAMEMGLHRIADLHPLPGAVVVLLDGDTFLPTGTLARTLPLLLGDSSVGAITTDNLPIVDGTVAMREWYRLRMRARHALMCSMALSGKLLVLTGRFSVFRSEIALAPGFIASVGRDVVRHWRFGSISMLTGDDKSTWFWTLREGWNMRYVPDVEVCCLESPPDPGFLKSTFGLSLRYYGNMARNNWRAAALGPRRIGWFPWFVLIDQRLSPWTSLTGPVIAVGACLTGAFDVPAVYLAWVMATRTLQTLFIGSLGNSFHPIFPLIQYYNQVTGSAIKIFAFFHLDRQKWTRQKTGVTNAVGAATSQALMTLSMAVFALAMLVLSVTVLR